MGEARRRVASIAILVVAAAALIATSPGEPTARARVQGDVAVSPQQPGEFLVRFTVPREGASEISHAIVTVSTGAWNEDAVRLSASAEVDGRQAPFEGGELTLPRAMCRDGCETDVAATIDLDDAGHGDFRTRWHMELTVVYEDVSQVPTVSATVLAGGDPPVPRAAWYVVGLAFALGAGMGLMRLGTTLVRTRLALATGMVVAPLLVVATTQWDRLGTYLAFGIDELLAPASAVALILAVLSGVWLTASGSSVALPAVGWIYLILVTYTAWLVVEVASTYRALEVIAFAVLLALPGVIAVTALPPGHRPLAAAVRVGTSLVLAVLVIQFLIVLGAGTLLTAGFVLSLLRGELVGPDQLAVGVGLAALVATYVVGFRRWPSGERVLLLIVCGLTLLVAVPLLLFGITSTDLIVASPEQIVFGALGISLVVACVVGLLVLPPPPGGRSGGDSRGPGARVTEAPGDSAPEHAVG